MTKDQDILNTIMLSSLITLNVHRGDTWGTATACLLGLALIIDAARAWRGRNK